MSRAGKFIPGGGGKAKRTGPIRAPDASAPPTGGTPESGGDGKKRTLGKGLTKPVAKKQRLPITVMGAIVVCALVSFAWYLFAYLPMKHNAESARAAATAAQNALIQQKAHEEAKEKAAQAALAATKGVLIVNSNPSGATIIIGDMKKFTPVKVDDLATGPCTVTIQMDGYEDYKTEVTIAQDQPVDLGTIQLEPKAGNLALASPQSDVTYTLTGPAGYTHEGTLPDKLEKLPIGDYSLSVAQKDWSLPPMPISIRDHDNLTKDVKFPYAKVTITSTPPGATVREGRTVLGQTPLTMSQVRPKDFHLTLDLPPYTLQRLDLHVADFANVNKPVTLQQDKDFIAACGMPMVWIPDGGYWVAKYDFRQGDFDKVAGYNPSFFRGANRPVETISWESAQAFIVKLNDYEKKAGKLPAGFHYSLPRESQWDQFNANADLSMAATSSITPLTSTQDVGYSAPNKYGLYDTLGNVWEWCLDDFDEKGDHTLRGGTWLSLPDNFPNAATRQGGPPKYADKFIGFRVVLVPNP
jgi:formylglycine-generating enzyme required for sulfatase activity